MMVCPNGLVAEINIVFGVRFLLTKLVQVQLYRNCSIYIQRQISILCTLQMRGEWQTKVVDRWTFVKFILKASRFFFQILFFFWMLYVHTLDCYILSDRTILFYKAQGIVVQCFVLNSTVTTKKTLPNNLQHTNSYLYLLFAPLYTKKEKKILLLLNLCRVGGCR